MNDYKSIWQKYTKSKPELTLEEYENLQLEMAFLKKQLSNQTRLINQLKQDALQDSLTGLWNRRKFQEDLDKALELSNRYERNSGILFIDLNHFKSINDSLGHLAGDAVLKHISKTLKAYCRVNDDVYRLGGDEFVVIMPELSQEELNDKSALITNIIKNNPCNYKGQDLFLSASVGSSIIDGSLNKNDIINNADKEMYKIKQEHNSLKFVS